MNNRLRHIDVARGIGILLVVFGHSWIASQSAHEKGKLWEVIYSFHMPLFFFISGLFFKPKSGLKVLALQKTSSLLKPYFVVLSLLLVLRIIHAIGYPISSILPGIYGYYLAVVYGISNTLPLYFKPLWFLSHLWVVYISSYVFLKTVGYEEKTPLIKSVFLLVFLLSGYFTIGLFGRLQLHYVGAPMNGLPFSIDIVCITAFYFLCGFTMREMIATINNVNNNWLLLFMATVAFSVLHYVFNYTIQLDQRIYDNLLVCTSEALCGIYITLAVSRIISKSKEFGDILAYIGSGSLFIFLFHDLIQNRVFGYLHDNNILGPYLSSFIAFPVAVFVPLILWEIVKKNYYLSLLLLPLKSNKTLQTAGEEKGI